MKLCILLVELVGFLLELGDGSLVFLVFFLFARFESFEEVLGLLVGELEGFKVVEEVVDNIVELGKNFVRELGFNVYSIRLELSLEAIELILAFFRQPG